MTTTTKHLQVTQPKRRHSVLWFLGTKTFIANCVASGIALGYFTIARQFPLVLLILLLWALTAVTWAEYRSILVNE